MFELHQGARAPDFAGQHLPARYLQPPRVIAPREADLAVGLAFQNDALSTRALWDEVSISQYARLMRGRKGRRGLPER